MRDKEYWTELLKLDRLNRDNNSITLMDLIPIEFHHQNLDKYERRSDGKIVRKDRWENGIRSIASKLNELGMQSSDNGDFEIDEIVNLVRDNLIHWRPADFSDLNDADFQDMNLKRYLIAIKEFGCLYPRQAVFRAGQFYEEITDRKGLGINLSEKCTITHYAEIPKISKSLDQ